MKDALLLGGLLLSFATAVTAHLTIAVGLLARVPRWRAPVALLLAPLAPYWAWREGMTARAVLWLVGVIAYFGFRGAVGS
jgi:hypothetical protein